MTFELTIKIAPLVKEINKYDPKSIRHASYKSLKDIAFIVARGGSSKDQTNKRGVPALFKEQFRDPVPLTLDSIFYSPRAIDIKDKVTFQILEDESKGNAPAKYLYPVIGGGSTQVYATRFLQYLRSRNYINMDQYPYPNTKYTDMVKTKPDGRVKPTVYRNTIWALSMTKSKTKKRNSKGSKIHDARVFVVKSKGQQDQKNKNLRPGIYRVKADQGKDGAAIPLFRYGKLPSIKAKPTFGDLVENIVNAQFENILEKNINKVGKTI